MSQILFKSLGKVHDFFNARNLLTRPIHFVLDKFAPSEKEDDLDWIQDADHAILSQTPLRAKRILYMMLLILVLLVAWASITKIDEITRGEGRVIPSQQVQVVQSYDGGIVSELLVKEGQIVEQGQPLVKIDQTRAISSLRENRSQYLSLLAKQSRLKALATDTEFKQDKEIAADAPGLYAQEYALYKASKAELASQIAVAQEQVKQRERELAETYAKLEQAKDGYALAKRELDVTRPLEASGAVSEVDLLRLERDTARLRGDRDQAIEQVGRVKSAIAEAKRKIAEIKTSFLNQVRTDLSETTAKLNAILEVSVALDDKVKQSVLKAPVNGTVSRLFYNTVGGVIQPGKEVLELVPTDDTLVLETKITPRDIAFVGVNQSAAVKLTAYDYTIYGTLDAKVKSIAADSIIDENGNAFYIVKVQTLKPNLGDDMPIIPGMVAQVDILTGKKSVLSYLLKPVLKAKSYAFTER